MTYSKEVDEYIGDVPVSELKHYGVLGMKWGVRKDRGLKKQRKESRKDFRQETYKNLSDRTSNAKLSAYGVAAITGLGVGPALMVNGYDIARSAGYKKGQSFAIGFLSGSPGGIVASELRGRKRARDDAKRK